MKWTAVCLVAVATLGCLCDAQYGHSSYGGKRTQKPGIPPVQEPITPHEPTQSKQTMEIPVTWRYPMVHEPEPLPQVPPFELRHPIPASTVAVECRENMAHVEVMKDFFGTGNIISRNDLKLGTCEAVGEDAQVLIFEADLQGCDSVSAITDESLVYGFSVNYDPEPITDSPVVRASAVAVTVDCYYPRKQNVSSLALNPSWLPFSATKVVEELLYFSLKLMTDEWEYERPISKYFLGDMMNIEATVHQYSHVPLRVLVDNCVATATPDSNSRPRYNFIQNGCLVDALVTGSKSQFISRTSENKLRFQLEAFRFKNSDSGNVYIACDLKACSTNHEIDGNHRACSYASGWKEASGNHAACDSCESILGGLPSRPGTVSHTEPVSRYPSSSGTRYAHPGAGTYYGTKYKRPARDVSAKGQQHQAVEWEGVVVIGPITIGEKMV